MRSSDTFRCKLGVFRHHNVTDDANIWHYRRDPTSTSTLPRDSRRSQLGVQYVEIDKMNKFPMALAVALVLGAPLAFAANDNLPSPAAMTTVHCTNLETPSPIN